MDLGIRGKTALVTGASEGIGAGIARTLAAEGVRVAICSRTEAKLKETAQEIARASGSEVVSVAADLRSLAGCEQFVAQAAERLGGIDFLVNNVGASAFAPFVELPDEAFVDAINGKLMSYIRCTRAVIPHMQKRGGGAIVNITGTTQEAMAFHTAGSVCNAALRMFSKEVAIEFGPLKIRVNSIGPGLVQTARSGRMRDAKAAARGVSPDVVEAERVAKIPVGRAGTPDDIANAVCFLLSDRSGYINGAAVAIDGGSTVVI
jgi:3-oxoacyl-[acyl-carrier protein] reductase